MTDIKVFYLDYAANFQRLNLLAVPQAGETEEQAAARRSLYYNAVLTNLASLKLRPSDRVAVLQSLVGHLYDGGSLVGIQSLFLTLLSEQSLLPLDLYDQALACWSGAPMDSASDVGALYYDTPTDRLSCLSVATVQSLRVGESSADIVYQGDNIGAEIENVAETVFVNALTATVDAASPPQSLRAFSRPQSLRAFQTGSRFPGPRSSETRTHPRPAFQSGMRFFDAPNMSQADKWTSIGTALGVIGGIIALGGPAVQIGMAVATGTAPAVVMGASFVVVGGVVAIAGGVIILSTIMSTATSTTVSVPVSPPPGVPAVSPTGQPAGDFTSDPTEAYGDQGNEGQGNEGQGNEGQGNEGQGNEGQGNEGQGNEGQGGGAGSDVGDTGDPGSDDDDAGGGGGDCLAARTPIFMADGTFRSIARIKAGAHVLAFDPDRGPVSLEVQGVTVALNQRVVRVQTEDGSQFLSSRSHLVQASHRSSPLAVRDLRVGHRLLSRRGGDIVHSQVTRVEELPRRRALYHLHVAGSGQFLFGLRLHVGVKKN